MIIALTATIFMLLIFLYAFCWTSYRGQDAAAVWLGICLAPLIGVLVFILHRLATLV